MILDSEMREIVRGFFERQIVKVNLSVPFVLASGKTAPLYLDHRRIFSYPDLRKKVVEKWANLVRESVNVPLDSLVMAGTATAGIAPAYALAERLGCGFVYVRSQPKDHGMGNVLEGAWSPSSSFVVVDDMVTTGGSVLKAIENVRTVPGNVILACSITQQDFRRTREAFHSQQVELVSLFKTSDIFDIAYRMSLIDSREMRALMQWISEQE